MSQRSEAERRVTEEGLSALVDGELNASEVADACRAWRDDGQMRSQWHTYHLIGDVMRSEDLVSRARHDADFLVALRQRMAAEPVVLAPASSPASTMVSDAKPRRSWMAPAAVAAGFAVVAGTLVVTQMVGGLSLQAPTDATAAAQVPARLQPVALSERPASAISEGQSSAHGVEFVRDERLDAYLAAHKKFGGSSLPGGPAVFLRNASVDVPAR